MGPTCGGVGVMVWGGGSVHSVPPGIVVMGREAALLLQVARYVFIFANGYKYAIPT